MQDKIQVTFKGEPRDVFMSFMRLNNCVRIVGPQQFEGIVIDPDAAELIVQALLAPQDTNFVDFRLAEDDMSMEDFEKIVSWAEEHLADFFARKLEKALQNSSKFEGLQARVQALSKAGSAA